VALHPPVDLSALNPRQRDAVLQTEGPVLVLAGAGSGKTRVIAHRTVHLLDRGVPPRAILCVTFTNKAAAEMKERIVKLAGAPARCRGLTVSTFHAFGVRVLREHALRLGLPPKFAIFDTGDQTALLKRLMRDLKLDDKRFDVQRVLAILSRRRTSGQGAATHGVDEEYELIASELLPKYELGLLAMGAVDFDDLLLLPLKLLTENESVLQSYRSRFRYLMVDEYQDTNEAQFKLLEALSGLRRNLLVVGDDDQSIYSWRGAQLRHILEFDKAFPGVVEIKLEQNYRSTSAILDAANAVIGKNPARKAKKLWTDRGRGSNIRLVTCASDEHEAKHVADEIIRLNFEEKIPHHEMAVLYRTNGQSKQLEEALRFAGIRYRIVGGTSLFDRKEVRDLLAYLRAALNPQDEVSMLRIVNVPARGIGDQTVTKAREAQSQRRSSLLETFRKAAEIPELKLAEERIASFVALLDKYGPRLNKKGFSQAARELCEEVGLHEEARRGATSLPAQARKVEALEALLRQLVHFEQRAEEEATERMLERGAMVGPAAPGAATAPTGPGAPEVALPQAASREPQAEVSDAPVDPFDDDAAFAAGLPGYLRLLALDSRESQSDGGDVVTLMTLHGAKGLEWRAVFLCGLEEGLLPHSGKGFDDSSGDPAATGAMNLEEERRLCYVGITRARERLTMTRAAERLRRGKPEPRTPSRFLEDLPEELVDKIDLTSGRAAPESTQEVQKGKAKNFFAAMDSLLGDKKAGT